MEGPFGTGGMVKDHRVRSKTLGVRQRQARIVHLMQTELEVDHVGFTQ